MSRRKSISFRQRDVARPPEGVPWVWYTQEMLTSAAFRQMSLSCRKLIQYLEIENMHSAGHDNGKLVATYQRLQEFGLRRASIARAIAEAERLGLIEAQPGGYRGNARNFPSRYRLTFRPTQQQNEFGQLEWLEPTHDWKRVRRKPSHRRKPVLNGSAPEPRWFRKGTVIGSKSRRAWL